MIRVPLLVGAVALEAPQLPPLSSDPSVIAVIDVVRIGLLIAALAFAAVSVQQLWSVPRIADTRLLASGYRLRTSALAVALVYVGLSSYDRIGEAVTAQFPCAVLFLILTAPAIHFVAALPRPPVAGEGPLRAAIDDPGAS